MFVGAGTLTNVVAVLIGSGLGMLIGHRLPARVRSTVTTALGLVTLLIAAQSAADVAAPELVDAVGSSAPTLVVLGSLVLGVASLSSAAELGCIPGRPAAVLVAYARSGGFAGIQDRLRVYRGGQAELARRTGSPHVFRLSCRRVQALRDALVASRFRSLSPVYAPDEPHADGLIESVSYAGRTVRVLTGAEGPPRLRRVLALLRDIAARNR